MSSSGRYKSRFFNFLNQQSVRWNDQLNRAVRNLKVATVWGVQILLYPVYLGVQATRLAGYQLKQAAKQVSPQLNASSQSPSETTPTSDQPIQQVLSTIDTLALIQSSNLAISEKINPSLSVTKSTSREMISVTEITSESGQLKTTTTEFNQIDNNLLNIAEALSSNRQVIQGIGCLLTTRSLVLVTTENQILDILTPQQQEKIQQKISWELAQYWQQKRIINKVDKFQPQLIPPVDQPHVLAPVRWFWELIAWVQTGKIAIAANLFQESSLVAEELVTSSERDFKLIYVNLQSAILDKLPVIDNKVADLEKYPLLPPAELKNNINYRTQLLIEQIKQKLQLVQDDVETENSIQALIKAAITYFFGHQDGQLSEERQKQLNQHDDTDDPWLSASDLFGEQNTFKSAQIQKDRSTNSSSSQLQGESKTTNALPEKNDTSIQNSGINNFFKHYLTSQLTSKNETQPPEKPVPKNQEQITNYEIIQPSQLIRSKSNNQFEHTPEWIETKATPVGYVKHPLEQLLQWLDRGMLWLEELTVEIWRRLKKLI